MTTVVAEPDHRTAVIRGRTTPGSTMKGGEMLLETRLLLIGYLLIAIWFVIMFTLL